MADIENTDIEGDNFASSQLECGQFEMKKETITFSKRCSLIYLGLEIRSRKFYAKLRGSSGRYLTEQTLGILALVLLLIIIFSILFHITAQNASINRGKYCF